MKTALTVDEQIQKLKGRGMVFADEDKAREILMDIGYYRLGFYSFPFERTFPNLKNRDHQLVPGTTFRNVVELYYFDFDLRRLLLNYLNRIEVNIRTQITYIASNHYKQCPTWFVDPNVMQHQYIAGFDKTVYDELRKNPILQRHHRKYINDKYAPAWKTLEFMTMGNIWYLFTSFKDPAVSNAIAAHYKCSYGVFSNYLETIRTLRNRCAHGSCLYNFALKNGIMLKPAGIAMQNRHNIAGAVDVVKFMLGRISSNRLNDFHAELDSLLHRPRLRETTEAIEKCSGFKI